MKHLIEFNLETLEVIKIDPIFEEVDETIIESTGIPEELIIEPITIIDSDTATVIYEGALPCDREGYTKTLYFGYEDNDNNNAVVLLNKSLTVKQPIVYAVYTEIEGWFEVANQKDVENLKLQNQGVYGLGFKSGDNTVNLKTPEINLGLNDFTVEIWARCEGCSDANGLKGRTSKFNTGDMFVGGIVNTNNIGWITMQSGLDGDVIKNSIYINKTDSTKNLHHIIITRSGTLVTATINGRRIKTVTQDRVLDFSKFVFDIANTTYFSLGRVFNYAMSQEEAVGLWNGGRVDEVVLGDYLLKSIIADGTRDLWLWKWSDTIATYEKISNQHYKLSVEKRGGFAGIRTVILFNMNTNNKLAVNVKFSYKSTHDISIKSSQKESANTVTLPPSSEFAEANLTLYYNKIGGTGDIAIASISDGQVLEVKDFNIRQGYCLLELLPQNIHSSGIYNTGSLGSSHDAVLSKPIETIFHREKPYKDKQMSVGAPSFHPIAMGQKVYSDTGLIYEAAIPPTSREWSTADWKQVNNN